MNALRLKSWREFYGFLVLVLATNKTLGSLCLDHLEAIAQLYIHVQFANKYEKSSHPILSTATIFVYLVVPGRCLVKEARFGGKCTEKDANQMTPRHGGPTDPVFKIHERLIILLKKGAF